MTVTVADVQNRPVEISIEVVDAQRMGRHRRRAKKSGQVLKTWHNVGDHVQAGDMLVELDPVNADLMIQQAEKRMQTELSRLGLTEVPKPDFDVTTIPNVVQRRSPSNQSRKFRPSAAIAKLKCQQVEGFQNSELDLKNAEASYNSTVLAAKANLAVSLASAVELDVAKSPRSRRASTATIAPATGDRTAL